MPESVYEGSDGRYYTDVDLWERLEAETWVPCAWDPETGQEWVETPAGDLLALTPVAESDLIESTEWGTHRIGTFAIDEFDLSRTTSGD